MWRAFPRFKKDECSRTRGMLSGYIDQRLNSEELTQVEEHIQTCQGCREELESLRATVALLHRLPEVTPSRSFTVAPVKPLPGRRALWGLRFATAGAAVLLVVAFAADRTNLFQQNPFHSQQFDSANLDFGSSRSSEEGDSYWVVSGVKYDADVQSETPVDVDLVVPDGSDNVYAAITFLSQANEGVLYADLVSSNEVSQVVLREGEEWSNGAGEAEEFTLMPAPVTDKSQFATNDAGTAIAWYASRVGQDGSYLNLLNSDNSALYSFDLSGSRKEFKAAPDHDWLRPLEYGLIGLVVVLGGATLALRLRQRRRRAAEVS